MKIYGGELGFRRRIFYALLITNFVASTIEVWDTNFVDIQGDRDMNGPNVYLVYAASKMETTIDTMIGYAVVDTLGGSYLNRVDAMLDHRRDVMATDIWFVRRYRECLSPAQIVCDNELINVQI